MTTPENPKRRAVSINYHFVRPPGRGRFQLRAHERPDRLEAQLRQLAEHFEFARCRELFDGDPSEPRVLVTFDDGALDVVREALPALQRHDATATAFICSRPYVEQRLLQIQRVEYLISALGLERLARAFYEELERRFPGPVERESLDFAGGYQFYRYDDEPIRRFKLDLNYRIPYARVEPVLEALFEATFGEGAEADAIRETYLSVDELRRLQDAGVEIGTHAHSHRVLPRLGEEEQRRELATSAEFVRGLTGEREVCVAYPFGFHDEATKRAAGAAGLLAGFAGQRRWIEAADVRERWSIPRYDVNDCFDRTTNRLGEAFLGSSARSRG